MGTRATLAASEQLGGGGRSGPGWGRVVLGGESWGPVGVGCLGPRLGAPPPRKPWLPGPACGEPSRSGWGLWGAWGGLGEGLC